MFLLASVFRSVLEFLIEFFSNITIQRIFGAIILIGGMWLISKGFSTGDPNSFILYATGGILFGGIGAVIIYHDFAKDKTYGISHYNELETLTRAYDKQDRDKKHLESWHMDDKNTKN